MKKNNTKITIRAKTPLETIFENVFTAWFWLIIILLLIATTNWAWGLIF